VGRDAHEGQCQEEKGSPAQGCKVRESARGRGEGPTEVHLHAQGHREVLAQPPVEVGRVIEARRQVRAQVLAQGRAGVVCEHPRRRLGNAMHDQG